ncbi:hypothetical protein CVU82_02730 [Candidatus Falkowbacteria bacterium HGW-Falkowbacteria-1]|jgi:S-adenosylmethionine:diacylglycerol 3-amino-3-carboxypropyl transferase|uniref:DUF3419 domain-containing protein n=1 Tax=Candidatus Falkowbacteria bacterium HGW-Falkowbacteria-1 TaxID=2013768 RepID=A0A2N2E9U5_9BACT|nr:MAG: hypothetical protein CVU82_02730 [Candidatus Falkowbacteria bacterium HGW-Falkowbacteria-1]
MKIKKTIKPAHDKMTSRSPMYIYATEMVSDYYSCLNLEGKRVLSICGSGDQIINAFYFGAREVVAFDINYNSFFILDLKLTAINKLNYLEFINFFGSNLIDGSLEFGLYNKLKVFLSVKTRNFFDKLYKEFDYKGKKLIKSDYFRQRSMFDVLASDINYYLKNEKEYLKCREIVQNRKIQFLQLDVNDILTCKKLKGGFDIINLSNVLNYLTGKTEEENVLNVLVDVSRKINKKVNKDGVFFYYSYSPSIYKSQRLIPPASRFEIIKSINEINNFKFINKRFRRIGSESFDRINILRSK